MNILGIDYGRKKIGLSLAVSKIAEPYMVIRYEFAKNAFNQIKKVIEKENIEKIVIGVSENLMGSETKRFAENLKKEVNLPIDYQDETLSSQEAIYQAIQSGMKRKKRHEMEDAYAATIMLQNYLDSNQA